METALFLGAGSSFPFGFPVTADLLPRTLEGLDRGTLFYDSEEPSINAPQEEKEDMTFLFQALRKLLPGWHNKFPKKNLPLITELLSLVDYSLAEAKPLFPGQTQEEALRVRRLLERAIYEVLWEGENSKQQLLASLRRWVEKRCEAGCGVITTNYDTCLEQTLFNQRNKDDIVSKFDFGFAWLDAGTEKRTVRPRPTEPWLRWFKLHGSLNWARCPACEHLFVNPSGDIAHQTFRRTTDRLNTCHCGDKARLQLHLVAPSMYRTVRDANLLEVWKNALHLLLEADEWIIIGYSLPSEDIAIRSMLVRAFHAHDHRDSPRVTVVQFGKEAEPRYKLLFPDCDYRDGGLEAWL